MVLPDGVGSFAVQIAKARGARVIATASTANQNLLKQFGADVAIDYTKTKFEDVAKDVDVVLDPVGRDTLARSYAVVKKGGVITTLVQQADPAELARSTEFAASRLLAIPTGTNSRRSRSSSRRAKSSRSLARHFPWPMR